MIVCSHFERPKGKRVPEMSLRPVAAALGEVLGRTVAFADDCVGPEAEAAVERLRTGDVLVLENTRFHPGEEKNDPAFAAELAELADLYVNDAFSAAHRAHASTEGVAHLLPSYAGRLMQQELEALEPRSATRCGPSAPWSAAARCRPSSNCSATWSSKVDVLVIGGAMANTFLAAQGAEVGRSLQEADMHGTAREILAEAGRVGCEVVLPTDAVVAREFKPNPATETVPRARSRPTR